MGRFPITFIKENRTRKTQAQRTRIDDFPSFRLLCLIVVLLHSLAPASPARPMYNAHGFRPRCTRMHSPLSKPQPAKRPLFHQSPPSIDRFEAPSHTASSSSLFPSNQTRSGGRVPSVLGPSSGVPRLLRPAAMTGWIPMHRLVCARSQAQCTCTQRPHRAAGSIDVCLDIDCN